MFSTIVILYEIYSKTLQWPNTFCTSLYINTPNSIWAMRFCFRIVVSNTYCVVFLFCFSSSCVPYAASFSGLSICNCPFGILVRLFKQIHAFLCFKKFCIYMKYSYKIMWRILFAGLCTYASIYFTCELNSAQVDFSLYFAINSIKKQIVFTSSCLIYVVCVCLCIVVPNTYCVVFLFCFSSSCVAFVASFSGLSFLIASSVFANVYLIEHLNISILILIYTCLLESVIFYFPLMWEKGSHLMEWT
jgi:hypothetical protein